MKASPASLLGQVARRTAPRWTCSNCRTQVVKTAPALPTTANATRSAARQYATNASRNSKQIPKPPRKRRGVILTAAATAGVGTGALAFTDDIKHGYEATERAGRVAAALGICINEYVSRRRRNRHSHEQMLTCCPPSAVTGPH